MKKAIVYCRSATADPESDARLAKQKKDCLEYAREHGFDVLEVISESGYSGLDPHRKGLQKLLSLCDESEIALVITTDITRLSRDQQQVNSLIQTFTNAEVELVTLFPHS